MKLQGAIFDFDGVIVDTTPLHYHSWRRLLIYDHKIKFDSTVYEDVINGRRSADVIPELLPHLSPIQQKKALALKQEYYHRLIEEGKLKIFPSTIRLINELRQNNVKIAVASSSRSVAYVLKRANIIDLFDAVISGKDTKKGKPHPESFLLAAEKLGIPTKNCIVFEDAKAGVRAAKNGGFLCVAIARNKSPQHFRLADLCVDDLSEITYTSLSKIGDVE